MDVPVDRLWEEAKKISEMTFRFIEREEPISYVEELSILCQLIPVEYVSSLVVLSSGRVLIIWAVFVRQLCVF